MKAKIKSAFTKAERLAVYEETLKRGLLRQADDSNWDRGRVFYVCCALDDAAEKLRLVNEKKELSYNPKIDWPEFYAQKPKRITKYYESGPWWDSGFAPRIRALNKAIQLIKKR